MTLPSVYLAAMNPLPLSGPDTIAAVKMGMSAGDQILTNLPDGIENKPSSWFYHAGYGMIAGSTVAPILLKGLLAAELLTEPSLKSFYCRNALIASVGTTILSHYVAPPTATRNEPLWSDRGAQRYLLEPIRISCEITTLVYLPVNLAGTLFGTIAGVTIGLLTASGATARSAIRSASISPTADDDKIRNLC